MGHHYAIWASDSNILLAKKKYSGQPKAGLISGTVKASDYDDALLRASELDINE